MPTFVYGPVGLKSCCAASPRGGACAPWSRFSRNPADQKLCPISCRASNRRNSRLRTTASRAAVAPRPPGPPRRAGTFAGAPEQGTTGGNRRMCCVYMRHGAWWPRESWRQATWCHRAPRLTWAGWPPAHIKFPITIAQRNPGTPRLERALICTSAGVWAIWLCAQRKIKHPSTQLFFTVP